MARIPIQLVFGILLFRENITKSRHEAASVLHGINVSGLGIYRAEYDIVNLLLPLDNVNFNEYEEKESDSNLLFFVLADNENGQKIDKGLFALKQGKVTKLLDYGRDAAAGNDETNIYFGAKDGLYFYNQEDNKAEKYGNITDSIISIAKFNGSDIIYILTEDHILYKVTQGGMRKEKIEEAVNAQKIVLDYKNNLYYYTTDKHVYILGPDGAKKVTGLVEEPAYIDILRPPLVVGDGIPVILDHAVYMVSSDGTSKISDYEFEIRPTAFSLDATLIQYFAYNKKIYEYNILSLLFHQLTDDSVNNVSDHQYVDFSEEMSR
ncbi:unnamed protein product [Arctia plantaginis]|uniref:Uncharacterized protein n=1 Tax=Arctia plantaginis TaxID=874455 RepID=A0A8S1B8T2_ARCPL|nr:unnamed protein product [Arctia plantaginis]